MKGRSKADVPELRPGCFPQRNTPHPPHGASGRASDGLHIRKIPEFTGPVVRDINGELFHVENESVWEVQTTNGWRFYVEEDDLGFLLPQFLTLVEAGHYGVHLWMRGHSWKHCHEQATQNYNNNQEPYSRPQQNLLDDLLGET